MISGLRLPLFEIQSFDPTARAAILELFSGEKDPIEYHIPLGRLQARFRIQSGEGEGDFKIKAISVVDDKMEPSLSPYLLNDLTTEGASDPEAAAQAIRNILVEAHRFLNDNYREIPVAAEALTEPPTLNTALIDYFGSLLKGSALYDTLLQKTGRYVRNGREVPIIKTTRPLPLNDSHGLQLEYKEDENQIKINLLTYQHGYVVAEKVFIFPKQEGGDRINWNQVHMNELYASAEVPQEKLLVHLNELASHLVRWNVQREAQLAKEVLLRERRDALLRCLTIYEALKKPPITNAVEAYSARIY